MKKPKLLVDEVVLLVYDEAIEVLLICDCGLWFEDEAMKKIMWSW